MTAVLLFDNLSDGGSSRKAALAEKLVASSLSDLDRISDYERTSIGTGRDVPAALQQSINTLYSQWLDESAQVLTRVASLEAVPANLTLAAKRLEDSVGRVRARLSVSAVQQVSAINQAREGQFIPAEGLRNELRSRFRA